LWQVIRKGFWLLGLLPTLLDYTSAYVPADRVPKCVSDWLAKGASLQLSLILVAIALLVSAFLVHSKTEARLKAYEHQAPDYELKTKEVSSKLCPGGVHIECGFSMKARNQWPGCLARVTVESDSRIQGLADWKLEHVHLLQREVWVRIVDWPFSIPQSESDFQVTIHSEIREPVDSRQRAEWENAVISLRLLIEHYTQPAGHVRRLFPLEIQVNLGKELDAALASRRTELRAT